MVRWETVLVPLVLTCSCHVYDPGLLHQLTEDARACVDAASTRCNDRCVDLRVDPANCGNCSLACGASELCVRSECVPAGALDASTDAIVDVSADVPADHGVDALIDAPCSGHVVINEVSAYDLSGDSYDEFVEIYNPGTCTALIGGWTLRSRFATNEPASIVWTAASGLSIRSGAFAVVGGTTYRGQVIATFTGSTTGGGSAIAHDGAVGLFNAAGTIVDSVAYDVTVGSLIERTPYPSPMPPGQSLARRPNGVDTDDNARDFVVAAMPTPGAAN